MDSQTTERMQPEAEAAGHPARPIPYVPPVPERIGRHGAIVVVLVLLVNLAQLVLGVVGLLQFLWMLIARERNLALAEFGQGLGNWLAITARFVAGVSDERPFPWTRWR